MIHLLGLLLGVGAGFGGSRLLRRPRRSAEVASFGRSVGSTVGTRRDLDLPHLQRSTLSEMMRHTSTKGGTSPSHYVVRLHPDDHETVQQAPGFFRQGLEEALAAAGRDQGWEVPPRMQIDLVVDPARRKGAPRVEVPSPAVQPMPVPPVPPAPSATPAPEPGSASDRTQIVARPAARLERSDGGAHSISTAQTRIGRAPDREVVIDDSRVSRQHATVTAVPSGYTVTDEGSSNGTRLNGAPLAAHTPAPIVDGDRIGIGPVDLVLRLDNVESG